MADSKQTTEARLAELLQSPKRRKFVIAYCENPTNPTAAAEMAEYAKPREEGYRLLRNASVIDAIEAHMAIVQRVAGETRDTVLDRIRNRANVDPRDFFYVREITRTTGEGDDAVETTIEVEELKRVTALTKKQAQCIKKVTWNTQGFPSIEFHDSAAADRDLARLMGLEPKDGDPLTAETAAALIAGAMAAMEDVGGA